MNYRIELDPRIDSRPLNLPVGSKEEAHRQIAITLGTIMPITMEALERCGVKKVFCGKTEVPLEAFVGNDAFAIDITQAKLIAIAETWVLSDRPEFRGFRCADCQQYLIDNAWHYFLREGGYLLAVHFCGTCRRVFDESGITSKPRFSVVRKRFMPRFPAGTGKALHAISRRWNRDTPPVSKVFTCDRCKEALPMLGDRRQGWHVWQNQHGRLIEYHFDDACARKIKIVP